MILGRLFPQSFLSLCLAAAGPKHSKWPSGSQQLPKLYNALLWLLVYSYTRLTTTRSISVNRSACTNHCCSEEDSSRAEDRWLRAIFPFLPLNGSNTPKLISMSNFLMQESSSIYILSSLSTVNSASAFFLQYLLLPNTPKTPAVWVMRS